MNIGASRCNTTDNDKDAWEDLISQTCKEMAAHRMADGV